MKRLWVQLSLAFGGVLILSQLVTFVTFIIIAAFSPTAFTDEIVFPQFSFESGVEVWVFDQMVMGKSAEEIKQAYVETSTTVDIDAVIDRAQDPERAIVWVDIAEGPSSAVPITGAGTVANPVFFGDVNLPLVFISDNSTIAVLVQSLAIAVIAGIFMSRYLTKPLGQLNEAVEAFGKRKLDEPVNISGSQEIEQLSQSFNQMADDLNQAEQQRLNILADVSHELRTPLTGLEGSLRASLDQVYEVDERHIANMHTQTKHLIRLVEDLRLLAQAEAKKLPLNQIDFELNQMITETVDIFQFQADDQQAEITTELPSGPVIINADADRIRQVLHNLLANGLRFAGENGAVTVGVQQLPDEIVIEIRDNGAGIEPEHLPHLFDRFYRTDKSRSRHSGGAGLGLAITKALIESHGGGISAASDGVGTGATFRFWLPQKSILEA